MKAVKELLIEEIYQYEENKGRNSMGANESWYDSGYSLRKTFTREQIESMTVEEIQNLIKLAENISEGLY